MEQQIIFSIGLEQLQLTKEVLNSKDVIVYMTVQKLSQLYLLKS